MRPQAMRVFLREVLAASKQVNLPVITGKLHVTQVNCARDLFTCELHVKLPAFAGNFARASFTVMASIIYPTSVSSKLHKKTTSETSMQPFCETKAINVF